MSKNGRLVALANALDELNNRAAVLLAQSARDALRKHGAPGFEAKRDSILELSIGLLSLRAEVGSLSLQVRGAANSERSTEDCQDGDDAKTIGLRAVPAAE